MRRCVLAALGAALVGCLAPWAAADDSEQAQRIAEQLRASGKLKGYSIGVTCEEGTVHLRGQVSSKQQLQQAVSLTKRMHGVKKVLHELNVAGDDGTTVYGAQTAAASMAVSRRRQESVPIPVQALPGGEIMQGAMPIEQGFSQGEMGGPIPIQMQGGPAGMAPAGYDSPNMPDYAWPSYAAHPNYAGVSYPRQYSPTAWPYIGPFYPYPQVPLGWRKVTLEWDDGWWFLDFHDKDCDSY